jgi:biofilm PGA synthesis N-glycosyltransferase PgaC
MKYVVITPVRNEGRFIGHTIRSMEQQTIGPQQWILVDDGSTDNTFEILSAASQVHGWITVVKRPDRGFRKSGGGVVEAFYDGYAKIAQNTWDFVVKLDGDLTFEPNYFERCLGEFSADPRLGIASGTIVVHQGGQVRVDSPNDPPFHVRGAAKMYRRACWDQISPLMQAPGWDTIDEVKANMHGWATRTFPDVHLVQRRDTGASDGHWRNWYKNGVANYVTGYHPVFMLAKCVQRAFRRPPSAALALLAGFCSGYIKRLPRVNKDAARYLRRQQWLRLTSRPSIYGGRATGRDLAHTSSHNLDNSKAAVD